MPLFQNKQAAIVCKWLPDALSHEAIERLCMVRIGVRYASESSNKQRPMEDSTRYEGTRHLTLAAALSSQELAGIPEAEPLYGW